MQGFGIPFLIVLTLISLPERSHGGESATSPVASNESSPQLSLQLGHTSAVRVVAFSPNGKTLASGGLDNVVKVWDVATGMLIRDLETHETSGVWAIAFSPDGARLASAGQKGDVEMWNMETGKLQQTLLGNGHYVYSIAFSPDGRTLAGGGGLLWSEVELWDLASGAIRQRLTGPNRGALPAGGLIYAVAFSSRGDTLAGGSSDGLIRLWDARTGDLKRTLLPGGGQTIWSLAFSPTAPVLASANGDSTVSLWDTKTGNLEKTFPSESRCTSVSISPDGRTLASGSDFGSIRLWDINSGQLRNTLIGHSLTVWSISFSLDGKIASGSGDRTIKVWDTKNGVLQRTLQSHFGVVRAVVFAPNSAILATGGDDGVVRLWSVQNGELIRAFVGRLGTVWSLAFSPDGSRVVAGLDKRIEIWDLKSGMQKQSLLGHTNFVYSVAFSPDGSTIASASEDGTIRFWDADTLESKGVFEGSGGALYSLAYSPDGKTLAAAGEGRTIQLWDTKIRKVRLSLSDNTGAVYAVRFSPNGKTLASGNVGKTIRFWNVEDGSLERTLQDPPLVVSHQSTINSLAFSSDGTLLGSASDDKTVKLWNCKTGTLKSTFRGHTEAVRTVAFSQDDYHLASGGEDTTIRIWDVRKGGGYSALLLGVSASIGDPGEWLALAPNGMFDGSAEAMPDVAWRDENNGSEVLPLDAFYNDFFHPGLLADIFEGKDLTPPYDLATRFRFPALRTMVQQGLASIQKRSGTVVLCLSQQASPASVKGLEVIGRGSVVAVGTAGFAENPQDSLCTYSKELPADKGPYELVGATTDWKPSLSSSTTPSLSRTADVSKSTLHVFTVGINKYVRSDSYPSLRFPVADADAVEDFFEKQKQTTKVFASVHVWKGLRDEAATKEGIRDQLAAMAKEVKEDDVVFLFFSGHGRVPPGQEMFYYIPYLPPAPASAVVVSPLEEREVGVNTAMFAEAIRNLPARRIVLVVDACQSGGVVESLAKIGEVKVAVEKRRTSQANRRTDHSHDVGVYILAAATPVQEALEPLPGLGVDGRKNGLLTTALLEALSDTKASPKDRKIWITKVFDRVKQELPKLAAQYHSIQTAFPVEVGSDFPIATKGN